MQGNLQDVGQGLANVGSTLSNITPPVMRKNDASSAIGEVTPASTSGHCSCLVSGGKMIDLILDLILALVNNSGGGTYIEGLMLVTPNIGIY